MKLFFIHLRQYVIRGLLALIPIVLTIFTVRIIYIFIDKRVSEFIAAYTGYHIPGLGLLLFIAGLYFIGMIASNVIGKKFFGLIENVMTRIPLIKTTYQIGKQVSNTLSLPEQQIFKKVVLVKFFQTESRVIGFVTGTIRDQVSGENLFKVFIPTVPNPTSGFLIMLKESETWDPQWGVEDAMKMVISGGIIGPEVIGHLEKK